MKPNVGYIVAIRRTDDNGNWYYDCISDAWETPELAAQWRDYACGGCGEVIQVDHQRI
jgi:hypothetical protein